MTDHIELVNSEESTIIHINTPQSQNRLQTYCTKIKIPLLLFMVAGLVAVCIYGLYFTSLKCDGSDMCYVCAFNRDTIDKNCRTCKLTYPQPDCSSACNYTNVEMCIYELNEKYPPTDWCDFSDGDCENTYTSKTTTIFVSSVIFVILFMSLWFAICISVYCDHRK